MSMIEELKSQSLCEAEMMDGILEGCDHKIWGKSFNEVPFWHEVYHTLFWTKIFLQRAEGKFDKCPYGIDIDPRLFQPQKGIKLEIETAKRFNGDLKNHIQRNFSTLTIQDLDKNDQVEGEGTVLHRILYGIRHTQHHIGKLTAYLNFSGLKLNHWKG